MQNGHTSHFQPINLGLNTVEKARRVRSVHLRVMKLERNG